MTQLLDITSLSLYNMCLKIFWREDIEEAHYLVREFWKTIAMIRLTQQTTIINLFGSGPSGKTTLLNIIKRIFGEDTITIPSNAIEQRYNNDGSNPYLMHDLSQFRYAIVCESQSPAFDIRAVKYLVGCDESPLRLSLFLSGQSSISSDYDRQIYDKLRCFKTMSVFDDNLDLTETEEWRQGRFTANRKILGNINSLIEEAFVLIDHFKEVYTTEGLIDDNDMSREKSACFVSMT